MRMAVLWSNMGPYHVARLNAFASLSGFEVIGIELSRSEALRAWTISDTDMAFSRVRIHDGVYESTNESLLTKRVLQVLHDLSPVGVAISGYSAGPMRAAARWAKQNDRVSVLMSPSQRIDRPRYVAMEWLKGCWIRHHFDAAFVAGARSTAYLEGLGFPLDRIWRGYDVVDNAHFEQRARNIRAEATRGLDALQLPTSYFLYVGRFAPEKNLERLLQAYARYRDNTGRDSWGLVMVGSGPLERQLKESVASMRLKEVHWPGFKQVNELPAYYALASCFVLPSVSEPWGLVVNEAMACGLPVLVSHHCGVAGDLVFPGVNGFVFDPLDVDGLAALMARMSADGLNRKEMGEASRRLIVTYTPEIWATALADCIRQTAARKRLSIT